MTLHRIYLKEITAQNVFQIFTMELFTREQTGNKLTPTSTGWVRGLAAEAHHRLYALQSTAGDCGKVFTIRRELIKAVNKVHT